MNLNEEERDRLWEYWGLEEYRDDVEDYEGLIFEYMEEYDRAPATIVSACLYDAKFPLLTREEIEEELDVSRRSVQKAAREADLKYNERGIKK